MHLSASIFTTLLFSITPPKASSFTFERPRGGFSHIATFQPKLQYKKWPSSPLPLTTSSLQSTLTNTINDYLQNSFQTLTPEFLDHVSTLSSQSYPEEDADEDASINRANAYATMPGMVLRSRSGMLLTEDFAFYCPDTGVLDKQTFLSMIQVMDNAFPDRFMQKFDFRAHANGLVTFIGKLKTEQFADFEFDNKIYKLSESDPLVIRFDYELHVVAFDPVGRILAHLIHPCDNVNDEAIQNIKLQQIKADISDTERDEKLQEMESRMDSMKQKLDTLKDQTSSLAYNKLVGDIGDIEMEKKDYLSDMEDLKSNVGKKCSIGGILYACGETDVSVDQVRNALNALASKQMGADENWSPEKPLGGISVPSCCLETVEKSDA